MFQVLDHARVVFTGGLSQATQYIIEHYGFVDEAIRTGIRITLAYPACTTCASMVMSDMDDDVLDD